MKKIRLLIFPILIVAGVWWFQKAFHTVTSEPHHTEAEVSENVNSPKSSEVENNPHTLQPRSRTQYPNTAEQANLHVQTRSPTNETLREQAKENPHETPPDILAFAAHLAPKIERALLNETDGQLVFQELTECLESREHPLIIRGICMSNAQLLAKKHDILTPKLKHLLHVADPELLRLL